MIIKILESILRKLYNLFKDSIELAIFLCNIMLGSLGVINWVRALPFSSSCNHSKYVSEGSHPSNSQLHANSIIWPK